MSNEEGPPRRAIVTAIREGHNGPYFLAECDIGLVTVSLQAPVWLEKHLPEGGIEVVLSDIRKKRLGWRAYSARFFRPGDEIIR